MTVERKQQRFLFAFSAFSRPTATHAKSISRQGGEENFYLNLGLTSRKRMPKQTSSIGGVRVAYLKAKKKWKNVYFNFNPYQVNIMLDFWN